MKYIIGIDEVGRGPIAGPVTVCACIVQADYDLLKHFKKRLLKDSKKLSDIERRRIRTELNKQKFAGTFDYVIASKSAEYIDKHGIVPAVQSCIQDALNQLIGLNYSLDEKITQIELDGALSINPKYIESVFERQQQRIAYRVTTKGDETVPAIAVASILAKIGRDNYMNWLHNKLLASENKSYGFDTNVGYGTAAHYAHIKKQGITKYHRQSFLKKVL
jgi:ribonuclease HII